mgnify:CR=1 FL=1
MPKALRRRLEAILVADGILTEEQLKDALDIQKETGKPLGQVLVEQRYLSEEALAKTMSEKYQLPFIDPGTYQIDPDLIKSFPVDMLYRYQFVPLDKIGKVMIVAVAGIIDESLDDFIQNVMGFEPMYFIATYSSVMRTLEKMAPLTEEQRRAVKEKIKEDAGKISERISSRTSARISRRISERSAAKPPETRKKEEVKETAASAVSAEPGTKKQVKEQKPSEKKAVGKSARKAAVPPPPPPPQPAPAEVANDAEQAEVAVESGSLNKEDVDSIDWQSLFDEVDRRIREEARKRRDLRRKGLL